MSKVFNVFLGCVIFNIADVLFVKISTKMNSKRKGLYQFIIIFVTGLIHTFMSIYLVGLFKSLLSIIIYIIKFKLLFDIKWKKSIFLSIMYFILLLISDLLTIVVAIYILKLDSNYFYNVFAGSFFGSLTICIKLLIITNFFKKFLNKILNIKLNTNAKIIIFSGLTLLALLIMFYYGFSHAIYNIRTLIIILVIGTFIVILFNLLKEKYNNDNLKDQYDKLLEFMATYEKEIENQRIIRHENKNNLIAIKSKIVDKDNEKDIINYIDDLLNISTKIKNEKYAKFGYLPSNGIKGLFYYKTDEAERNKIKVSINISKDIKKSIISKLDTKDFRLLGNIIGVFLDNAIEASRECKNKKMGIEIYTIGDNVEIIISNSYCNKINNKIGCLRYSTKGINRGHGLLLVDKIINHSKMFENIKIIDENVFTQKLIVKGQK